MQTGKSFFSTIKDPHSIITPTTNYILYPEILDSLVNKYRDDILCFCNIVISSENTNDILYKIRSRGIEKNTRMTLLKLFRRCVSPVLDTEMTKKITVVSTESLITNYGHTFKDISILKHQFSNIDEHQIRILAALLGEYDSRGQVGYDLTDVFFDWFENVYGNYFDIIGPRGAGRDIELSDHLHDFPYVYPCDFIIKGQHDGKIYVVGFARYDATRGGSQADDRTGGNSDKVGKAIDYYRQTGNQLKILFLADGPGLAHRDIWEETCRLDGMWEGRVRVTTLKTANERVSYDWLISP